MDINTHGELQNKIITKNASLLDVTCTASSCYKLRANNFVLQNKKKFFFSTQATQDKYDYSEQE